MNQYSATQVGHLNLSLTGWLLNWTFLSLRCSIVSSSEHLMPLKVVPEIVAGERQN